MKINCISIYIILQPEIEEKNISNSIRNMKYLGINL